MAPEASVLPPPPPTLPALRAPFVERKGRRRRASLLIGGLVKQACNFARRKPVFGANGVAAAPTKMRYCELVGRKLARPPAAPFDATRPAGWLAGWLALGRAPGNEQADRECQCSANLAHKSRQELRAAQVQEQERVLALVLVRVRRPAWCWR